MPLMFYGPASRIDQIECQPAELGTGTTIGGTAETVLRGIADSTIAYTQSAMYKCFQLKPRQLFVNPFYLIGRQFTSQHDTVETLPGQPSGLLCRPCITLRTGMKGHSVGDYLSDLAHQPHVL